MSVAVPVSANFTISPYPDRTSLSSRVSRKGVAMCTSFGAWKTPSWFLNERWLMLAFAPMQLSDMLRSVVGSRMKRTPR